MSRKEKSKLPQYNIEGSRTDSFLGPLEAKVLDTIWEAEDRPLTVREVHKAMGEDNRLAYTTIMTTMNRLFEKGLLDREVKSGKGGLYYVYWPDMERDEFERSAILDVLQSLSDKFGENVIKCIVEQASRDKGQLDRLKKELNELE
ncbi:MAG: BlaI/MecI/CopY family transcriptional regulator [Methanomassiliicoccus sp.]|jgi:predicted transcriptional regulator|nr:BlaI/MecI/CopY family transcriptional regulator [Methanomassiliicoccus sp.]